MVPRFIFDKRFTTPAVLLLTVAASIGNCDAASAVASSTVTILEPISIANIESLRFGRFHTQGSKTGAVTITAEPPAVRTATEVQLMGGAAFSPAIYTITGEPNRSYRINLPAEGHTSQANLAVGNFTLWSADSGTLIGTTIGHLNSSGFDTLRVGATVSVPSGVRPNVFVAIIPIVISYE